MSEICFCGEGNLKEIHSLCEIDIVGNIVEINSYYSVCDTCGSETATANQINKNFLEVQEAKKRFIPRGNYCYTRNDDDTVSLCPFWALREDKPHQENGYCSYMRSGDWNSDDLSLLWDQVKECGINTVDWLDEV